MPPTLLLPVLTLATLDRHMVAIPGGAFDMGGESFLNNAKPIHRVQLDAFSLCRYPVTQRLWREVMGQDPEQLYFVGEDRPVEGVSWYDAVDFCNQLSTQEGLSPAYHIDREQQDPNNQSSVDDLKWTVVRLPGANGYRLPTEAEWEYAARGGPGQPETPYAGSADLDEVGWYDGNSYDETQPVGLRAPNALGLYDLSGNVWEWCQDWYDQYPSGPQKNPTGPANGASRVYRGGCWSNDAAGAPLSSRFNWHPDDRSRGRGLRLARSY